MKKKGPSIIFLVVLAVGALSLAALYAYLYISLVKVGERQRDFAGEIRNADKIIQGETENRERIMRYFVKEGEQAAFVSGLERACTDFSIKCGTRSLSETEGGAGAPKLLSMIISAEGPFDGVMGLLAYLETSPYPIEVTRSALFAKEAEWEGVFDLSVPVLITQ